MVDGLDGLRHDAIVSCHNDNNDIRYFRTTSTHGSKRFVTRSIEERDFLAIWQIYVISSNVLSDTTCFTSDNVGTTNIVEQRCFTVVNVSHDGDNWRTEFQIFGCIFLFCNGFDYFRTYIFGIESKLFGNDVDDFGIESHID